MKVYIGIDTSTTATKSLLIDQDGKVIAVAFSEYEYETPQPLWSQQNPELWWQATIISIRSVLDQADLAPASVDGIGLTGQMHGLDSPG